MLDHIHSYCCYSVTPKMHTNKLFKYEPVIRLMNLDWIWLLFFFVFGLNKSLPLGISWLKKMYIKIINIRMYDVASEKEKFVIINSVNVISIYEFNDHQLDS